MEPSDVEEEAMWEAVGGRLMIQDAGSAPGESEWGRAAEADADIMAVEWRSEDEEDTRYWGKERAMRGSVRAANEELAVGGSGYQQAAPKRPRTFPPGEVLDLESSPSDTLAQRQAAEPVELQDELARIMLEQAERPPPLIRLQPKRKPQLQPKRMPQFQPKRKPQPPPAASAAADSAQPSSGSAAPSTRRQRQAAIWQRRLESAGEQIGDDDWKGIGERIGQPSWIEAGQGHLLGTARPKKKD